MNDLFVGGLAPGDKLAYVNYVIKGKLMESEKLAEQALNNSKEQFVNSPDLASEKTSAVLDAFSAYSQTSKHSLESEQLRADRRAVLLGARRRWEGLRANAAAS